MNTRTLTVAVAIVVGAVFIANGATGPATTAGERVLLLVGVVLLMVAAVGMLLVMRSGPTSRYIETLGNSAVSCTALGMAFSVVFDGASQFFGFAFLAAGLGLWVSSQRNVARLRKRRAGAKQQALVK